MPTSNFKLAVKFDLRWPAGFAKQGSLVPSLVYEVTQATSNLLW